MNYLYLPTGLLSEDLQLCLKTSLRRVSAVLVRLGFLTWVVGPQGYSVCDHSLILQPLPLSSYSPYLPNTPVPSPASIPGPREYNLGSQVHNPVESNSILTFRVSIHILEPSEDVMVLFLVASLGIFQSTRTTLNQLRLTSRIYLRGQGPNISQTSPSRLLPYS